MKFHRLTDEGREAFREWLVQRQAGDLPPSELLNDASVTELAIDIEIDHTRVFANRFDFGKYIAELLKDEDAKVLLSQKNDGLWDWLSIVYFSQFGKKVSKPWHYTVTRGSVRISVCEAVSEIGCWVNFILIQAPARPPEAPRLSPVSRVPPLSFCTPIGGLCESVFVQYCKLVHR